MRPAQPAIILLTVGVVALSGCIDPAAWEAEAHSWDDDHEDEHDDHADDECADDASDRRSSGHGHAGGDHAHHDEVDPEEAFSDASPRYSNEVDGDEDSTRTVRVPLGADELRIALVHDSDGDVRFRVSDPLYRTWAEEETDGRKYLLEEKWAVITDPVPGDWRLHIDIDGESRYTVGFYLDD